MNFSVIVLILLRYFIPLARAGPNEYDVRPVGAGAVHLKGDQK